MSRFIKHPLQALHFTLRLGLAGTFVGHGWMAFSGFENWVHYLTCAGVSENLAIKILPAIGVLDWLVGLFLIFYPKKPVLFWALGWLILVAFVRPLCGESWVELIKRGGYIACALGLILLSAHNITNPSNRAPGA